MSQLSFSFSYLIKDKEALLIVGDVIADTVNSYRYSHRIFSRRDTRYYTKQKRRERKGKVKERKTKHYN